MVNSVEKGLQRSDEVRSLAMAAADRMKRSGSLSHIFGVDASNGLAQLSQFTDQGNNRRRYALFRDWVYSAVHTLAKKGASQPFHIGRMESSKRRKDIRAFDGEKKADKNLVKTAPGNIQAKAALEELHIITNHEFSNILENPNPLQHRWQFVYSFIGNLCITGWGYIVKDSPEEGVTHYYSLPTTWVKPDHSQGAYTRFKIINPDNPTHGQDTPWLDRSQVAFAYLPNLGNPLSALAPSSAQQHAIKIDTNIQSSQTVFFENGIFPSAIITVGKQPTPDGPAGGMRPVLSGTQRRQIYAAIRKISAGIANYGNPAIVDGLIENITRFSADHNEMGWEKSEKNVRTRILSAFGVHPFILGEQMAGSYAQAYVVEDIFCGNVNVFLDLLGNVMTQFARGDDDSKNSDLLVWWEECQAQDPSLKLKLWLEARKNDDITQDELRAEMGLPPDEDRNQSVINKQALFGVIKIAEEVTKRGITEEQALAILEGLGIPSELATKISTPGEEIPPEPLEPVPSIGEPL